MSTNVTLARNENPYRASFLDEPLIAQPTTAFPTYPKVMFILAIVFSVLRLMVVPLSIVGYQLVEEGDPLALSVLCEVVTGAIMGFVGIVANGLLLAQRRIGISLAWIYVASGLSSLAVAVWQARIAFEDIAVGTPEFFGGVIGLILAVGVRFVLIATYLGALVSFIQWFRRPSYS